MINLCPARVDCRRLIISSRCTSADAQPHPLSPLPWLDKHISERFKCAFHFNSIRSTLPAKTINQWACPGCECEGTGNYFDILAQPAAALGKLFATFYSCSSRSALLCSQVNCLPIYFLHFSLRSFAFCAHCRALPLCADN